jgi:hypothetical protein
VVRNGAFSLYILRYKKFFTLLSKAICTLTHTRYKFSLAVAATPKAAAAAVPLTEDTSAVKDTPTSSRSLKTPGSTARKRKQGAAAVSTPGTPAEGAPAPTIGSSGKKKMTPKQLALSEEKRKKAEALAKEKEEKERKRQEVKAQKEKEKEEKERHKEEERRAKELERLEKERIKKEAEKEKEAEKQRKKAEKEAEMKRKEEETKRKEEEKLRAEEAENAKKRKAEEAFKQFFKKPAAEAAAGEQGERQGAADEFKFEERKVGVGGGGGTSGGGGGDGGGGGGNFTPFQVKKNMRLAPLIR